eukprot:3435879-Pyramimonas_sp.AAC.1
MDHGGWSMEHGALSMESHALTRIAVCTEHRWLPPLLLLSAPFPPSSPPEHLPRNWPALAGEWRMSNCRNETNGADQVTTSMHQPIRGPWAARTSHLAPRTSRAVQGKVLHKQIWSCDHVTT